MRKFLKQCTSCNSTRQSMPNMETTLCPDCGAIRDYNRVLEDHELKRPVSIQADATSPNLEELRKKFGIKRIPNVSPASREQSSDEMITVEHIPGDRRFNKVKIVDKTTGQIVGEQG